MSDALLETWIARHFPSDRERIYLDTAAAGQAPHGMGAAVAAFYDGPLRSGIGGRPIWRATGEAVRARVAWLMNVPPADIEFFGNTTHGLNLAAGAIRWSAGDEIVLAADEHASVRNAWEPALRAGARIVVVPIGDEAQREHALLDAVTPRTRVLAVSHVHSGTGFRMDLAHLRAGVGAGRCLLVVDGIQALGAIPVDASLADVYCAATFKWLCAGFGLSVMATSAQMRDDMLPLFRGYVNEPPSQLLQYSHWNYPALWALRYALDVFEELGWAAVYRAVSDNAKALAGALEAEGLFPALSEQAPTGIVTLRLRKPESEVTESLAEWGVQATVRNGMLRLSPHASVRTANLRDAARRVARCLCS